MSVPTDSTPPPPREVWFLTGSQGLYGEETLQQVAEQSQAVAALLDAAGEVPVPVVWKPVLTSSDGIHRTAWRPTRDHRVRRCHRLDAHVLAGPDVDRRPGRVAHAAAAPAHPGQRVAAVGDDRHGLHEPQPGRARRPRVRLRPGPPRRDPQDRVGPRQRPGRAAPGRRLGAGRAGLGGGADAAAGPLRRQHAQRRGDRRRQGRGAVALGVSVNGYGGQRPGRRRRRRPTRRRRPAGRGVRRRLRRRARAAARRRAARVAALLGAIELGLRAMLEDRRFGAFTDELRGPRRAARSCPAWPCSG